MVMLHLLIKGNTSQSSQVKSILFKSHEYYKDGYLKKKKENYVTPISMEDTVHTVNRTLVLTLKIAKNRKIATAFTELFPWRTDSLNNVNNPSKEQ